MNTFFTDFKRSLADWGWYKEIARGEHPLRLSYAVVLSFISALITTIFLTVSLYTIAIPEARNFLNSHVPSDVIVTIKSNEISVNQPTPYAFPLTEEEKQRNKNGKVNFLVIDPEAEATLDSPQKYQTFIFANKNTVVTEESSGEIKAYPLKDIPDTVISRDILGGWLETGIAYAWILPIIAFLPIMLVIFIGQLVIFAISGFLLWVILAIASRNIKFRHAFMVSMYAYTFIFIIDLVIQFFHDGLGFAVGSSILLTVLLSCLFLFMPSRTQPVIHDVQ